MSSLIFTINDKNLDYEIETKTSSLDNRGRITDQ